MEILITLLLIIFIFGILVGIHEFGHFWAAKKCGVWVQEFAFGFGPTLYRKKYKETIYKINLVPLGGYVKLFGERKLSTDENFLRNFEKLKDSKENSIKELAKKYELKKIKDEYEVLEKVTSIKEIKDKDKDLLLDYELNQSYRVNDNKRYSNKSISQRAFIISAGVIMNLILGVLIYSFYLIIVNQKVLLFDMANSNFYGAETIQLNSPVFIEEETLQLGSNGYTNAPISKVNGEYITDLNDFIAILEDPQQEELEIEYYKNGNFHSGVLNKSELYSRYPELEDTLQYSGRMIVGEIIDNSAASKAGLEDNMILLEIAGNEVSDYEEFTGILEDNQGQQVDIVYYSQESKEVIATQMLLGDKTNDELIFGGTQFYEYYPFGYFPSYLLDYAKVWPISGLVHSFNITKYQYDVLLNIIKYSFETKDTSLLTESVGGPIRIGNEIGNLVRVGNFTDILNLAALISLSLAVMNILPIPIVDGGHLLFLLIEKIKGSPLSDGVLGFLNLMGLVFIIFLSLVVTLKDIWTVIFK